MNIKKVGQTSERYNQDTRDARKITFKWPKERKFNI